MAEKVRYRDELINRITYFGMDIAGVLLTAFLAADVKLHPLILAVISITSFVFLTAVYKYKDPRDWHWKRRRDLERMVPSFRDQLTVFHSNRTPKRRWFDKHFSLSSTIINLFLALFLISLSLYVVFVAYYAV